MNVMSNKIECIYSVNTIAYMYIQTNREIYGYFFIIMKNHEIMLYLYSMVLYKNYSRCIGINFERICRDVCAEKVCISIMMIRCEKVYMYTFTYKTTY